MERVSTKTGLWNRAALWACITLVSAILLPSVSADLLAGNAAADNPAVTEYEVKAAYVYYFAKFIEWPQGAFSAQSAPVTIGIIGNDEFGALLGNIVKNKTIQEHPIAVRLLKWPSDLQTCHMVYISSSEQKRFRQIAESLRERSTLTITETEEDSQAKGIVNLFVEGGKVQFEVDISAAEKVHLHISSKLLRLARGSMGARLGKGE